MRPDDAVGHRQAEARSLADLLGREERVENALQVLLRDPAAGVRDGHLHRRHGLVAAAREPPRGVKPAGDEDAALFLDDGLLGVDQDVHQHLLDQVGIHMKLRKVPVELRGDLDVLQRGRALDEAHGLRDEGVEVHLGFLRRLLAREVQQPADDARAAPRLADHQVEVFGVLAAVGHLLAHEGGERQHAGERVVQLVGDAGGQLPDRGELLAARDFGFGQPQLLGALLDLLAQRLHPFLELVPRLLERRHHGVRRARQAAEFVLAAHGDGLVEVARRQALGAAFEVAQGHVDQPVQQPADADGHQQDETDRDRDHLDHVGLHGAVDLVQRIGDVHHAEHGLGGGVGVAGRRGAGRLVADHFHVPEQLLAVRRLEDAPLLVVGDVGEHLVGFVADRAVLGVLVHALADLAGEVGMCDDAVLAQDPHAPDAFLLAHVLDDLVHDVRLVQQHRMAGAALDHLRQLRHVRDQRAKLLVALLLDQQGDEQPHDAREHEDQVQADFELEASR